MNLDGRYQCLLTLLNFAKTVDLAQNTRDITMLFTLKSTGIDISDEKSKNQKPKKLQKKACTPCTPHAPLLSASWVYDVFQLGDEGIFDNTGTRWVWKHALIRATKTRKVNIAKIFQKLWITWCTPHAPLVSASWDRQALSLFADDHFKNIMMRSVW